MREDKQSFLKDIFWAFNIGWVIAGSVVAGFLIGKLFSNILKVNWIVIFFSIIGAMGGMWIVWKYYSEDKNG